MFLRSGNRPIIQIPIPRTRSGVSGNDEEAVISVHINSLPNETLDRIFSFLDHGDLLWARLVCRRFNEIVTRNQTFLNKSRLAVVPNPPRSSTLLGESKVKWKNLLLGLLGREAGRIRPIRIPSHIQPSIEDVNLILPLFTWKTFGKLLIQLPNLRVLKICDGKLVAEDNGNNGPLNTIGPNAESILNGITSLILIYACKCDFNLLKMCQELKGHLTTLSKLDVFVRHSLTQNEMVEYNNGLFELIEPNIAKLKSLKVCFGPMEQAAIYFLRLVIQKMIENQQGVDALNLDTVLINRFSGDELTAADLQVLLRFLQMNKNLTKVSCLPGEGINLTEDLIRQFIIALPKSIIQLKIPLVKEYLLLDGGILKRFPDLEEIELEVCTCNLELLGQKFPKIRKYEAKACKIWQVRHFTSGFPNLTHLRLTLVIQSKRRNIATPVIQCICQDLQLLVSLELDDLSKAPFIVNDSSVTGISPSYCRVLEMKPGDSLKEEEIPPQEILGVPFSNLKRLQELSIHSTAMELTDVGICFGFRFQRLKKLTLSACGEKNMSRVTKEGLRYIAAYNTRLRQIHLKRVISAQSSGLLTPDDNEDDVQEKIEYFFEQKLGRSANIEIELHSAPLEPPSQVRENEFAH